ncbi:MAG: UDP-N-acetylmuramoyl-L-alanine--D-glutamate ligase [Candidatus Omnitrophota bacterium]
MIDIKGKKVLVVGLGASGYAAAELLFREGARVSITEMTDTMEARQYLEKLAPYHPRFELAGHTESFCGDCELVVTSPGVDVRALPLSRAGERQIPIIGEMELGSWFCRAPIVAVTGTNGKSTTVELIGRILSLSGRHTVVCGNIGNPLSGEVSGLTEESVAVVEVSSFQLETIKYFKPSIAVLLNISEDHYERHTGYDNYKAEKFKIFMNQAESDWAVLHSCFSGEAMTSSIKSRLVFFGPETGGAVVGERGISVEWGGKQEVIIKREEVPLKGRHNLDNVACSVLVSRLMGVDNRNIREGIMTFKGLNHRFEKIGFFRGVEFIDDSKATNIDATRRALESMDKKVVLIAGGRDKGGDYLSVLPVVKEKVKAVVVIGEARDRIKDAFSPAVQILMAENMADAVKTSFSVAGEGEAVMLSPMCSSFDMFSSYAERGEAFQREVANLVQAASHRPQAQG